MRFSSWQLGAVCLLLIACVGATTATAQTRRIKNSLEVLPGIQAEYALEGDTYAWLGINGLTTTSPSADLRYLGLRGGYEHFWNTRWSGGGMLQLATQNQQSNLTVDVTPELYVRHWNTFSGFNFRQRLGLLYFIPAGETPSRSLTRLRFDLDRLVPVGNIVLRPRLAYEVGAYLRLQRDADEPKERVIDYTSLRAEVGVRLSDHIDFTPWFVHQTQYSFTLPSLDKDGNILIRGGRGNFITPALGLDIRYTLFRNKEVIERRQLPTQY